MNESFNAFRVVPASEIKSEHAYRAFRHFPELSKSIDAAAADQTFFESNNKNIPKLRQNSFSQKKSTHKLDQLCKSSLSSFTALSDIRKSIINDRTKHRDVFSGDLRPVKPPDADPLTRANKKLMKYSIKYDSRRMINDLAGFQDVVLSRADLDYQLKRCLTIYLTEEELEALFVSMDTDNSQFIDGVEFVRYFFKLGNEARHEYRSAMLQVAEENKKRKETDERLENEREFQRNLELKCDFSELDRKSVLDKVSRVAEAFTGGRDAEIWNEFGPNISAVDFKTLLEINFGLKLSNPEMSALVHRYEHPPMGKSFSEMTHNINGESFARDFFKLKASAADRRRRFDERNANAKRKMQEALGTVDYLPKSLGR